MAERTHRGVDRPARRSLHDPGGREQPLMHRSARSRILAAALAVACGAGFSGCRSGERPESSQSDLPSAGANVELPPFSLIDQTGSRFGSAQLDPVVWIAHLTFSRCREICPDVIAALR